MAGEDLKAGWAGGGWEGSGERAPIRSSHNEVRSRTATWGLIIIRQQDPPWPPPLPAPGGRLAAETVISGEQLSRTSPPRSPLSGGEGLGCGEIKPLSPRTGTGKEGSAERGWRTKLCPHLPCSPSFGAVENPGPAGPLSPRAVGTRPGKLRRLEEQCGEAGRGGGAGEKEEHRGQRGLCM